MFSANSWTLGPLDPWTLIILAFDPPRLPTVILSHPKKKLRKDEWERCYRSVYVVKKISSVSCILPVTCIPWALGCVVAVNASSFTRDCLHLDSTRKEFNYMKLKSSSATSNKDNNSTCLKGLKGLSMAYSCVETYLSVGGRDSSSNYFEGHFSLQRSIQIPGY